MLSGLTSRGSAVSHCDVEGNLEIGGRRLTLAILKDGSCWRGDSEPLQRVTQSLSERLVCFPHRLTSSPLLLLIVVYLNPPSRSLQDRDGAGDVELHTSPSLHPLGAVGKGWPRGLSPSSARM